MITFVLGNKAPIKAMTEETVATRLKVFMDSIELSHSQFADRCGIPRPTLSQLLSGRNKKISDLLVGQIHHAFPDLSVLWLLFGEGSMIVSSSESPGFSPDPISDISIFEGDCAAENPEVKENGLETALNQSQTYSNKKISPQMGNVHSSGQINDFDLKPRKVIQITVYYDDSTFETFYPEKNK